MSVNIFFDHHLIFVNDFHVKNAKKRNFFFFQKNTLNVNMKKKTEFIDHY